MTISEPEMKDKDIFIAATAVVEEGVKLAPGVHISDYVVLRKGVSIGENTKIFPHAVIGEEPQDTAYQGENTAVIIGKNNIIREQVTIHRASGEGQATVIGDNNMLMVGTHLAHNVQLGSNNTIANSTQVGGHVILEDYITIGGNSAIHQNVRVGSHTMLSGLSATNHDLPPYFTYVGLPSKLIGFNKHGLVKRGFAQEVINEIARAFKIIYRNRDLPNEALVQMFKTKLEPFAEIQNIISFIERSKRGVRFYPNFST